MRERAAPWMHLRINVPDRRLGTLPPVVRHFLLVESISESMWQRGLFGCLGKVAGGERKASWSRIVASCVGTTWVPYSVVVHWEDLDHLLLGFALFLAGVDAGFDFPHLGLDMLFLFEAAVDAFAVVGAVFVVHAKAVHGGAAGADGPGDKPGRFAEGHIRQPPRRCRCGAAMGRCWARGRGS